MNPFKSLHLELFDHFNRFPTIHTSFLKAVEMRNWLFRKLKCDISVFDILSPMSLARLSVDIVEKSKFLPESVERADQF